MAYAFAHWPIVQLSLKNTRKNSASDFPESFARRRSFARCFVLILKVNVVSMFTV